MTDEHTFRPKYTWGHWQRFVEPPAVFLVPLIVYMIHEESQRGLLSAMLTKGIAFDPQAILLPDILATLVFAALLAAFILMVIARLLAGAHIQKLSYDNDGLWLHRGLGERLHIPDHSVTWEDEKLALGKRHRFALERLKNTDELKGFLAMHGALAPERAEMPQSGPLELVEPPLWHNWKARLARFAVAAVPTLLFFPRDLNVSTQTLWIIDGVLGAAACVTLVFLIRRCLRKSRAHPQAIVPYGQEPFRV